MAKIALFLLTFITLYKSLPLSEPRHANEVSLLLVIVFVTLTQLKKQPDLLKFT